MRSLLLLYALSVALILVCKPSQRFADSTGSQARSQFRVAAAEHSIAIEPTTRPVAKPHLLSLLTLGAAVLGAVSTNAAESPLDANAQLAVRIVDTTAELEASADRINDVRARCVKTHRESSAVR